MGDEIGRFGRALGSSLRLAPPWLAQENMDFAINPYHMGIYCDPKCSYPTGISAVKGRKHAGKLNPAA